MVRYLIASIMFSLLSACGSGNDSEDLPKTNFKAIASYNAADFNLSLNVDYWELRQQDRDTDPAISASALVQLDVTDYEALAYSIKAEIDAYRNDVGFGGNCLPTACVLYILYVIDDTLGDVTSKTALVDFFGGIDTEAELAYYLKYAYGYQVISYDEVAGGYNVYYQLNGCSSKTWHIAFVDTNGVITGIKKVKEQKLNTEC